MARSPEPSEDVQKELELIKRLLGAIGQAVERLEQQLARSEQAPPPTVETSPTVPPPSPVPPAPTVPPSSMPVEATQPTTPPPPQPVPQAPVMRPITPSTPPTPSARPFAFEEEPTARELEQTLGGQVAL